MKKLAILLIVVLAGLNVPAQDFVSEGGSITISFDVDNDKVDIKRCGEVKTYKIASYFNFPVTHSDFGILGDDIYTIRMKKSLFGGWFTRCVIIHCDYTKEKYKFI